MNNYFLLVGMLRRRFLEEPTATVAKPLRDGPAIGSLWEIDTEDPFPSKHYPIKVLEVKDGWVRYRISRWCPDERAKCKIFYLVYRPANNEGKVTANVR